MPVANASFSSYLVCDTLLQLRQFVFDDLTEDLKY